MPILTKSKSSRNRSAGHNYERDVVKALNKSGFIHAVSSRSENRSRDNAKVDICNKDEYKNGRFGYNLQCKSIAGPVPYIKLLSEIEQLDSCINVILHRYTKKSLGGKFMVKGEYAIMSQADFIKLISKLNTLSEQLSVRATKNVL